MLHWSTYPKNPSGNFKFPGPGGVTWWLLRLIHLGNVISVAIGFHLFTQLSWLPLKRWTCYILELTPSTLTSMHKYINAQIIAKKMDRSTTHGVWIIFNLLFSAPTQISVSASPSRGDLGWRAWSRRPAAPHPCPSRVSRRQAAGPVQEGKTSGFKHETWGFNHGQTWAMGSRVSKNWYWSITHHQFGLTNIGLSVKHRFEENILELKHVGFSTGQVGCHMVGDLIHLHQTYNPGKMEKFVAITLMWAKQKWQTIPTFTWFHHEWVT